MRYAKYLLVALALWMPAASFAASMAPVAGHERAEPCAESSPDELSEPRFELDEMFLPPAVAPLSSAACCVVHHERHFPLEGHVVELLIPPPNPASSL